MPEIHVRVTIYEPYREGGAEVDVIRRVNAFPVDIDLATKQEMSVAVDQALAAYKAQR